MYLQDSLTTSTVGKRDGNMAVKTARAQQGLVQDIDPVCGRQHNDSLACIESIKLYE